MMNKYWLVQSPNEKDFYYVTPDYMHRDDVELELKEAYPDRKMIISYSSTCEEDIDDIPGNQDSEKI